MKRATNHDAGGDKNTGPANRATDARAAGAARPMEAAPQASSSDGGAEEVTGGKDADAIPAGPLARRMALLQANLRQHRPYLLAQSRVWLGRCAFWLAALAVGLSAVGFALLTEKAAHLFVELTRRYPWAPFLVSPLAGASLLWVTRRGFRGAEGSGIPQVIAELRRPRSLDAAWRPLVSLRIAFGKVFIGVAAVGAGFSFGREGPTVQVGACLMAAARRFLPTTLRIQRHHLLVAGGAAGIAAAFNTPLAGIAFALEELFRNVESRMSGVLIAAIALAGMLAKSLLGSHAYYGQVYLAGGGLLLAVLICAVASGAAGGLFARMLVLAATGWRGPLARLRAERPYVFAALVGLFIAALGWASGGLTWGSGYAETRAILNGHSDIPWFFGPAKFVATVSAYLSGLPGGIFAPLLAIGAGLGQNVAELFSGPLVNSISSSAVLPGAIVVLCMVGFLSAATQAPITAFIIVMEMVGGYPIVFELMAVALIASAVSRLVSPPLYLSLANQMIAQQRRV